MSPDQFPIAAAPEFAFLGRSNVGKSSLINGLLGEKAAKVSASPGRTRSINFFALSDSATARLPRLLFADLPGYGYAKISRSISAEWPKFINPYLEERPNLVLCICLVDSNIPVQASDQQLIASLKGMGRSFLVRNALDRTLVGADGRTGHGFNHLPIRADLDRLGYILHN